MSEPLFQTERSRLKEFLINFFNLDELEDIVFDLSISLGSFGEGITKSKLVRELISYCERRNLVDCLLIEIVRRRNTAHETLSALIEKFKSCQPRKKVQIILQAEELTIPLEQFRKTIASLCPNLSEEEIVIIAAARGSVRILLSIPEQTTDELITSFKLPHHPFVKSSIELYSNLIELDQGKWRAIATVFPFPNEGELQIAARWDQADNYAAEKTKQRKTILVAENDLVNLKLISHYLEEQGYKVLSAKNPTEAKNLLVTQPVHIAILDIQLTDDTDEKDQSGLQVARLQLENKQIPKIVLTSHPSYNLVVEVLKPISGKVNEIVDILDKREGLSNLLKSIELIEGNKQWKLFLELDRSFSENELREFFAEAGLNYSHMVGNKQEKISALLRYFEHGEGLASLILKLNQVKPNREWILV